MVLDLEQTDAPSVPLLSLDEAKAQCRVLHSDDDVLIEALIDAATQRFDGPSGILGRALVEQTWTLYLDHFHVHWRRGFRLWSHPLMVPRHRWRTIELPLPQLISVASIGYVDCNGDNQTVDPSTYAVLDGERAEISLLPGQLWPQTAIQPRAVSISFTCGYGAAAADVPAPIRHAAKLLVSHYYEHRDAVVGVENRDSSTEMPLGVAALIAPYRLWRL
jgi:uncharacterized phiE125 gp8 family phage protein